MRRNRRPGRVALGLCTAAAALLAPAAAEAAPTWTPVASGTGNEITGIEYQSPTRFWFTTAAGEVFTRQGDGSFAKRAQATASLSRIAFQPNGNVGLAIGPQGDVLRSTDAGQSWSPVGGLAGRNADCDGNEPLNKAYAVRWASNDVVYVIGGNKLLRSPSAGAPGTWSDVNALSPTGCKADFDDAERLGATDAFFTGGDPNRAWFVGSDFGEIFSASNVTANSALPKLQDLAINGYSNPKRIVGDPAQPSRQWGIAINEGGNASHITRTIDGWNSVVDFGFPGLSINRPERASQFDIAYAGGTLVTAGDAGMIENAIDGQNLYYAAAGGGNAGTNWRAVDLANGAQAAAGGVGGALVVTNNANSIGTPPPPPPPCRVNCGPGGSKPRVTFEFGKKGEGISKPKIKKDKKGRKVVTINVKGRLGVPRTVNRAAACRGNVTITILHNAKPKGKKKGKKGWRSIGVVRKAKVSSTSCAYKKSVRFFRSKVKGKQIRVVLEFPGNTVVARASYRKTLTLKG